VQSGRPLDCAVYSQTHAATSLLSLRAPTMFGSQNSDPARRVSLSHNAENSCRSGRAVAIVTDDTDLADVCARVLAAEGYSVLTAVHSGHVLLACLRGERIDVLISEMSMDEGSGPALTQRLRRHKPDLRAVYIAKPGTFCAAENVIVRPFTREDLLSALERQLNA
jgi:CheY-like chemotaxis protein